MEADNNNSLAGLLKEQTYINLNSQIQPVKQFKINVKPLSV